MDKLIVDQKVEKERKKSAISRNVAPIEEITKEDDVEVERIDDSSSLDSGEVFK